MTLIDARDVPADPTSVTRLAAQELTYRLIDNSSESDTEAFLRADARGFLDPDPAPEVVQADRTALVDRRNIGVFTADAAPGTWPIATVNSWVTPLTVDGGELPMWAISSVTVSGTHRRRGIARALLEGELRAAASAGVPIAGLTVSEATIYSRYGFGAAVPVVGVTVDARRAGWIGPDPAGTIEYVDRETLASTLAAVHEVERTQRSGQIAGWEGRWARVAGIAPGHPSPAAIRGVRYRDVNGAVRGVMSYRLTENQGSFGADLAIQHIGAVTQDALIALWRFALHHDLVAKVTADLRPLDDPIAWLVADQRAVEFRVHDHGWLRILDVPTVLAARTYRAELDVVLKVDDSLGFAAGSWRLHVDGTGRATVAATKAAPDVVLGVLELSVLFAGAVPAVQLAAAGRITGGAEIIAALDDAFRTSRAPLLGFWY